MPFFEFVVNIKSLNHRSLDLRFHTGPEVEPFESAMRGRIAARVARGHLDIRVRCCDGAAAAPLRLNQPLLRAYVDLFRQAVSESGLAQEPDLNRVLSWPGVVSEPAGEEGSTELEATILEVLDAALTELNEFRGREGAALAGEIRQRVESVQQSAARIGQIRARALPLYQARLRERLGELLAGASIDPQRLAQEAALLADRSDIGEELARLTIHAGQVMEMLNSGGEIGKRLDFLLQEMQREANTVLSKTSGVGELGLEITDLALGIKADIEKIREQALNLE